MTSIATSTIAAQAFRFLEMQPISSFADTSEQAGDANSMYPDALNSCLEANDWSFASVLADLPEMLSVAPVDDDLGFGYQLPGDLVRLQEVRPLSANWRIDGTMLRTDQSGPQTIRYTRNGLSEAQLPAKFKIAVAAKLASLLAPRWTQSISRSERLEKMAEARLTEARRTDARTASPERYDGQTNQPDWADEAVR